MRILLARQETRIHTERVEVMVERARILLEPLLTMFCVHRAVRCRTWSV